MADSPTLWRGARGWGLDVAFVAAAGFGFVLFAAFDAFLEAPLAYQLVGWPGTLLAGALLYGLAIRAAVALDGRWRVPAIVWLLVFLALAAAPVSLIAYAVATHFWPVLKGTGLLGWYIQAASFWVPLVGVYGALTRRLWPLPQPPPPAQQAARIPARLMHAIICLQAEGRGVRVHTRTESELIPASMPEAMAQLGARHGELVHRAWWVLREAVSEVVADGDALRLRLVGGLEAPVDPNRVEYLRALGWLASGERRRTPGGGEVITLWGRPNSINVQKVLWALDELGLAFEHIDAGGDAGGLDDPAFRAMNPHGRVPVLKDGETAIWESNAIVRYLCAAYGPDRLCPTDLKARAECEAWMDWTATTMQPAISGLFWGWYRTPAAVRDAARNSELMGDCARAVTALDALLASRPFVAGEALSVADIPAGVLVYRYFELEIERPEAPAVQAWRGRLAERPAYAKHVMRPFGELFGRLAF